VIPRWDRVWRFGARPPSSPDPLFAGLLVRKDVRGSRGARRGRHHDRHRKRHRRFPDETTSSWCRPVADGVPAIALVGRARATVSAMTRPGHWISLRTGLRAGISGSTGCPTPLNSRPRPADTVS